MCGNIKTSVHRPQLSLLPVEAALPAQFKQWCFVVLVFREQLTVKSLIFENFCDVPVTTKPKSNFSKWPSVHCKELLLYQELF